MSSFQYNPDCCQMYSYYYYDDDYFFFVNVNLSVIPMTIMLCDYYYTKKLHQKTSYHSSVTQFIHPVSDVFKCFYLQEKTLNCVPVEADGRPVYNSINKTY